MHLPMIEPPTTVTLSFPLLHQPSSVLQQSMQRSVLVSFMHGVLSAARVSLNVKLALTIRKSKCITLTFNVIEFCMHTANF